MTGNFLACTYIAPYPEQIARQTPTQISVMLLIHGAAGVVSNFAVGPFASRLPQGCLLVRQVSLR
ncbi:MFS transporter [Pseudomonas gingeri]|uniref:MFS transporter n=1 Tax=Pseudomonas gingeri TaxID=117681 RepID=UPI0015A00BE2|nr:MFS transporter [Pseudomonas gingeri]NVZ62480.1 MFS transporter [Pseudomonas gingeri]NVZ76111.1 MFS transporter [Pseudomonas gingeri]